VSEGWFKKHISSCGTLRNEKFKSVPKKTFKNLDPKNIRFSSLTADLLPVVFNFDDEFFSSKTYSPVFPNYLEELKNFGSENNGKLKILHLNVNSLFLKKHEFSEAVALGTYDLISLNETKLDDLIPSSFFTHPSYSVIRRDRLRNGGGILIFVKKNLKVVRSTILKDFEGINVCLASKGKTVNVLFSYKPPSFKNDEYLDLLESFILSVNNNERVLIVGDLNMDPLAGDPRFLSFLNNFSLKTVTDKPTRIGVKSIQNGDTVLKLSRIDHIIYQEGLPVCSDVIGCPYSDHKFLVAAFDLAVVKQPEQTKESRIFSEKNLSKIRSSLSAIDFSIIERFPLIEDKWGFVKDRVIEAIENCCPLRPIKNKAQNECPWFDAELISAKNHRDYYHHLCSDSKNDDALSIEHKNELIVQFKEARKEFNRLNRLKIKEFFKGKAPKDFKNSKKFHRFYKSSIKHRSDVSHDEIIEPIRFDHITASTAEEQAEMFNSFFTNIESSSFSSEDESAKFIFEKFKELKLTNTFKTPGFSFSPFNVSDIENVLDELPSSSSPGHVGIHVKVLKAMPDIFCPILNYIFNSCLELRKIPEDWKIALVTPLYKNKGEKSDPNNYRAISVLSPIAKMFEKLLAKQIMAYFENNKLFFKGQHGFRSGFSCQTAMHEFISAINKALDKKLICLSLFIDFRKAFDLISSALLLLKLFHYGFDNSSLGLMSDYFSKRSQIVKIISTLSNPQSLDLGVPQGSVFGPLLFLIFINDLPFIIKALIELFADDTTITKSEESLDKAKIELEKVIEDLTSWCHFNKVDINWNKTFLMVFSKKNCAIPDYIELKGKNIKVVDEFKLLGFTIDRKLNFMKLVSETCLAVNRKLYSIKRLFYLCTSVKIQFFKTFVLPYFDYIFSIICYFSKEAIQRLANCFYISIFKLLKIEFDSNNFNRVNDLLEKYGLFAFQHRALERMLTFSFKIINFENSPPLLKEKFTKNADRNIKYNLRNKNDFVEHGARTKNGENTFDFVYTRLANKFIINKLDLKFSTFKLSIFNNINIIYENTIKIFTKFDLKLKIFKFG
jgi:hypothetical protein